MTQSHISRLCISCWKWEKKKKCKNEISDKEKLKLTFRKRHTYPTKKHFSGTNAVCFQFSVLITVNTSFNHCHKPQCTFCFWHTESALKYCRSSYLLALSEIILLLLIVNVISFFFFKHILNLTKLGSFAPVLHLVHIFHLKILLQKTAR